jgi:hypothetical protein
MSVDFEDGAKSDRSFLLSPTPVSAAYLRDFLFTVPPQGFTCVNPFALLP